MLGQKGPTNDSMNTAVQLPVVIIIISVILMHLKIAYCYMRYCDERMFVEKCPRNGRRSLQLNLFHPLLLKSLYHFIRYDAFSDPLPCK